MLCRAMEAHPPPLYVVIPGRVYRPDSDATHTPQFHQVEGLAVDEDITLADLRGTLLAFAQAVFGDRREVRLHVLRGAAGQGGRAGGRAGAGRAARDLRTGARPRILPRRAHLRGFRDPPARRGCGRWRCFARPSRLPGATATLRRWRWIAPFPL